MYRSSEAGRGACRFFGSGVVDNLELCEYRWGSKRGSYLNGKVFGGRRDATRIREWWTYMGIYSGLFVRIVDDR